MRQQGFWPRFLFSVCAVLLLIGAWAPWANATQYLSLTLWFAPVFIHSQWLQWTICCVLFGIWFQPPVVGSALRLGRAFPHRPGARICVLALPNGLASCVHPPLRACGCLADVDNCYTCGCCLWDIQPPPSPELPKRLSS